MNTDIQTYYWYRAMKTELKIKCDCGKEHIIEICEYCHGRGKYDMRVDVDELERGIPCHVCNGHGYVKKNSSP